MDMIYHTQIFYMYICVGMYASVCAHAHAHVGARGQLGELTELSLFAIWIPGTKLGLSGLAQAPLPTGFSH